VETSTLSFKAFGILSKRRFEHNDRHKYKMYTNHRITANDMALIELSMTNVK